MPEKFVVPQFIDAEDKILGPITVRQFLICLGATLVLFIGYRLLSIWYFAAFAAVVGGLAGTFSFLRINGQPFHIFFVNFLQTNVRAKLRVWHKELNDRELRALSEMKEDVQAPPKVVKQRPASTRLRDLALTVNTGGVYNPEEDL
jgi:hypothetical protein